MVKNGPGNRMFNIPVTHAFAVLQKSQMMSIPRKPLFQRLITPISCAVFVVCISAKIEKKEVNDDDEFSIAILPVTQYYTSEKHGGKKEMFFAQTDWITQNAAKEKIKYFIHLGDITDDGEKLPQQWVNAADAMYYYNDGKTYPAVYKDKKIVLQGGKSLEIGNNKIEELVNLPIAVRYYLMAAK